jgi:hypothetical protein
MIRRVWNLPQPESHLTVVLQAVWVLIKIKLNAP